MGAMLKGRQRWSCAQDRQHEILITTCLAPSVIALIGSDLRSMKVAYYYFERRCRKFEFTEKATADCSTRDHGEACRENRYEHDSRHESTSLMLIRFLQAHCSSAQTAARCWTCPGTTRTRLLASSAGTSNRPVVRPISFSA